MKKIFTLFLSVGLLCGQAYAAGGQINGSIMQESHMNKAGVIGLPDAAISVPIGPLELSMEMDGSSSINTIDNEGKIDSTVKQKSDIDSSIIVASDINTIENKGTIDGELVEQDSHIEGSSFIINTKVNSIKNH